MIKIEDIWKETDGGRTIIENLFPASSKCFGNKKKFKIRDEKTPSCSLFLDSKTKIWYLKDFGNGATKALNAVNLISNLQLLNFKETLIYINDHFCNGKITNDTSLIYVPVPIIEKTDKIQSDYTIVTKDFTLHELAYLGGTHFDIDNNPIPIITSEICKNFNLNSVDYYINLKGFKISSTEDYHIYYYDYGTYGKIYCPFNEKYRFIWKGKKPTNVIFGDNKTKLILDKLYNKLPVPEADYCQPFLDPITGKQNKPISKLILCSGPSDAINVFTRGYNVIWLNSETAKLEPWDFKKLQEAADTIYQLPDLDTTGKLVANKNALKYLNLHTIWLPDDLTEFKNDKKKPCKDVRDFFKFYKNEMYSNLSFFFSELVRVSLCLQFWTCEKDKNDKITYGISNQNLYTFLVASGYCQIPSKSAKGESTFALVKNNIIHEISDKKIPHAINASLMNFFKSNLSYYQLKLINAIHRTAQLDLKSLYKLPELTFDLKTFGIDYDFFFFKNTACRITANNIETFKFENTDKYVFEDKIINHNFFKIKEPFKIAHTEKYTCYKKILDSHKIGTPEYIDALSRINELIKYHEVWHLDIFDKDFSYIKFIYNTGKIHWEEEESGNILTPLQIREHEAYFVSKIAAIGYLLYRYKEDSKAWFVYCMETKQSELGFNKGGTGKTCFLKSLTKVRKHVSLPGSSEDTMKKSEFLFSEVVKDKTEVVIFDDIHKNYDVHNLLVPLTGDMEVRHLYINRYTIDFADSPKLCGSTNHPLKNIDDSVRRRMWLNGFCDYYHYADHSKGILERSMFSEFGKNIVTDYTEEEMNKLYNFFAYCLSFYLKIRDKIEPPLDLIEKRNLQAGMTDEFISWADIYFGPDAYDSYSNFNKNIRKETAHESFLKHMKIKPGDREEKFWKMTRFKKCLILYADYCNPKLIFNPPDLLKTKAEKASGDIRENLGGESYYCFHFRTKNFIKPQT